MCEAFHKKSEGFGSSLEVNELIMKIGIYQTLSYNSLPPDELQKAKSLLMGEILFFLTSMSVQDNIDVFAALAKTLAVKSS